MVLIRMRRALAVAALALSPVVLALLVATVAHAMCIPFPPNGGLLTAMGQTNFIVMDEATGRATVIANVGLSGEGGRFSLVVPTPAEPSFDSVSSDIWDEAGALTTVRATRPRGSDYGFGCSSGDYYTAEPADVPETGGVVIVGEQSVGAFLATTLTASSATALVDWLNDNDFAYSEEDSAAFAPYIARDWFFTAMVLDSTRVTLPPDTWNVTLDPVAISFDAATFELPLPILAVNRAAYFPVNVLAIARERTTFEGFQTTYANRISRGELAAIRDRAPIVAGYLDEGDFFVRMKRTFQPDDAMDASIFLEPAGTSGEVHPAAPSARGSVGTGPVALLLVGLGVGVVGRRRLRAAR